MMPNEHSILQPRPQTRLSTIEGNLRPSVVELPDDLTKEACHRFRRQQSPFKVDELPQLASIGVSSKRIIFSFNDSNFSMVNPSPAALNSSCAHGYSQSSPTTCFTSPLTTLPPKWYRQTPQKYSPDYDAELLHESNSGTPIIDTSDMNSASTPLRRRTNGKVFSLPLGASPIRKMNGLNLSGTPPKILTIDEQTSFAYSSGSSFAKDINSSTPQNPKKCSKFVESGIKSAAENYKNYYRCEIINEFYTSDSEDEVCGDRPIYQDSSDVDPDLLQSTPAYINKRKRQLQDDTSFLPTLQRADTFLDTGLEIRPFKVRSTNIVKNKEILASYMSICSNSTDSISASKISFSFSDSTPCPLHLKRKKSRNMDLEATPLLPKKSKRLLNLAGLIRSSADSVCTMFQAMDEVDIAPYGVIGPTRATPVSQSTPSNSRPSTPPTILPPSAENDTIADSVEYDFVMSPSHLYLTPETIHPSLNPWRRLILDSSASLRARYVSGDFSRIHYSILKQVAVSAAGMMDESRHDVHIGDKRIGDPYMSRSLSSSKSVQDAEDLLSLKNAYNDCSQVHLPLPPPFFYTQETLPPQDLLQLVGDAATLRLFYALVVGPLEFSSMIKSDRIRWHPDKWAARFRDETLESTFINMDIVVALSQLLNNLFAEYVH